MDAFIGQIMPWPAPYAPRGWALCEGSVLQISQYAALYAVIGHYYGGDGVTTFALPDLRGRTPVGAPQINQVGQTGGNAVAPVAVTGSATINITVDNLPSHNHTATFTPGSGANVSVAIPADNTGTGASDNTPGTGMVMGKGVVGVNPAKIYSGNASNTTLKPFDVAVPAATGTVSTANTGNGKSLSVPLSLNGNVSTLSPFVTLNYIIALDGNFPVRD